MPLAIETRKLTKRYGAKTAVESLDLEVSSGEIFGLLGPNGAGKTTTILMLLGLSEPTEGEALVAGIDPTRQPLQVKRHVGYLPDNVGFYGTLTGRENLRYTAKLNGMGRVEAEARISELLEQAGLADVGGDRVDTYSRGMRQRLGLADALVKSPDIAILDEPTAAIDPTGAAEILALIRSLAHDRGVAVLLSSHLLNQVQSTCDRIGIFVRGRMAACGTVADLARDLPDREHVIEVRVEGERAAAEAALRTIEGVEQLEPGSAGVWRVHGAHDLAADVAAALTSQGLRLTLLRRLDEDLEQLYRTYSEEADDRHAA